MYHYLLKNAADVVCIFDETSVGGRPSLAEPGSIAGELAFLLRNEESQTSILWSSFSR